MFQTGISFEASRTASVSVRMARSRGLSRRVDYFSDRAGASAIQGLPFDGSQLSRYIVYYSALSPRREARTTKFLLFFVSFERYRLQSEYSESPLDNPEAGSGSSSEATGAPGPDQGLMRTGEFRLHNNFQSRFL